MIKPISALINKDIEHDNVIISLIPSKTRERDIISSNARCPHLYVEDNKCKTCGAYTGMFGTEKDPLTYYKHLSLLANSFVHSRNVYIITDRYFPEEYEIPTFGMSMQKFKKFKNQFVYTLYNKVSRSKDGGQVKTLYIVHFTVDVYNRWKSKIVLSPKVNFNALLDADDTLFVNPSIESLRFYSRKFTYYISDSQVLDFIKQNKMEDKIHIKRILDD